MPRTLSVVAVTSLVALSLAACTAATPTTPPGGDPQSTAGGAPTNVARGPLPSCDEVTAAIGALPGPLVFNADASETQTTPEAYDQRVCVYTNADGSSQVGVTIAAIPFQQTEIDHYMTLPNAIADDRLEQYEAVLQTLATGDGDDGHLDSPLYLFDVDYSITIQAISLGEPLATVLPDLSVETAADAAFAVRELLS
ncbi:hypothetical protein BH10ACT7_BH10ACT7_16790 [soil metagenome]